MLINSPSIQNEIIDRLVREFKPDAIYLFGSHAWGEPGHESDLDLLVIISRSDQNPIQRAMRAQRSLRGLLMPVDVLVRTRAEVDRYRGVYASLEAQILEKGKLLYGCQS
jgi:predicted nucleotidyltransferase